MNALSVLYYVLRIKDYGKGHQRTSKVLRLKQPLLFVINIMVLQEHSISMSSGSLILYLNSILPFSICSSLSSLSPSSSKGAPLIPTCSIKLHTRSLTLGQWTINDSIVIRKMLRWWNRGSVVSVHILVDMVGS